MEICQSTSHVVVLPYPCQGHINPLLQFAKRLASKGVKATLATTPYTIKSICAPNVGVEPVSDGFDDDGYSQAGNEEIYLKSFKTSGSRTLSELIRKFANTEFPVTCVVYDSFLPWALDVAKQHGILGASFFTNSVAVSSIFCRLHHGMLRLPLEVDKDKPLLVPGLPPLHLPDLPTFLKSPESHPAYLKMKLGQYSNLDKADLILANSFEELEYKEARSISELWPAKLIGPMVPSAYLDGRIKGDSGYGASLWKPHSNQCLDWLDNKPAKSVVYVSFGSMVSLTSEQIEEIALGLKESNMPFLWVLRQSEHHKLPEGFAGSVKEKGLIVTWCNQLELLAHQATGCFITHCGWNSTLEGLSIGVPMIGIPQWSDQKPDAKYVEEIWGVGVRAKEDENGVVTRQELLRCLNEIMKAEKNEVMRENANKWKELAKEAVSEGGSSDKCIEEFLNYMVIKKKGMVRINGFHKH